VIAGLPSEKLDSIAWPAVRAGEAVSALAVAAGLPVRRVLLPTPPADVESSADRLALWIERASVHLGLDAEPVGAFPPALVALGAGRIRAVCAVDRTTARVIAPDGVIHRVPLVDLWDHLVAGIPDANDAEVENILTRARVPGRRRARARESLRRTRLSGEWVEGWWMLRPSPSATLGEQVKHARLVRRLIAIIAAHALVCALGLGAWWLIGRGALGGRGGAGRLFGGVFESEAIEALGLSGGCTGAVSVVELVAAGVVLACGSSARWEVTLLVLWLLFAGVLLLRYWRARRDWTDERLEMTHALVEKMVGHRTRLAQERSSSRHSSEDEAVARSLAASERMDRQAVMASALVPQGWLVVGIAALVPAFAASGASSVGVAISVGGVLLAYRALRKLVLGLTGLSRAHIAWRRVRPLLQAIQSCTGTSAHVEVDPRLVLDTAHEVGSAPILDAREVSFSYPRRADPVLRECDLALRSGDRVLLEGASGGGKSTLSALLAGLREPTAGVLLLGGLDLRSLGHAAWRRRVALAPQFHENHVLTGTFAFNLLMGRRWPPRMEDIAEAQEICHELGLGPLLARMPSGIEQMVGETGWQLSQGERSRLFLARALLQNADVLVLDEAFAALDPHTTRAAFSCVLRRARTLLVVAHP